MDLKFEDSMLHFKKNLSIGSTGAIEILAMTKLKNVKIGAFIVDVAAFRI